MKSDEKFYYLKNGGYCGFLLREPEMKELSKILDRHHKEVCEFLSHNLDELELYDWTIAYPNGEQNIVKFYKENENKKIRLESFKEKRLKLKYEPVVFIAESKDDAEEKYIEWWKSEKQEVESNGRD